MYYEYDGFSLFCDQEDITLVRNHLESLGNDLPQLPSLHMVNCRYNKLTDAGIPKQLFALSDLSIVVS